MSLARENFARLSPPVPASPRQPLAAPVPTPVPSLSSLPLDLNLQIRIMEIIPVEDWCNGNTPDSGSGIPGSNPGSSATCEPRPEARESQVSGLFVAFSFSTPIHFPRRPFSTVLRNGWPSAEVKSLLFVRGDDVLQQFPCEPLPINSLLAFLIQSAADLKFSMTSAQTRMLPSISSEIMIFMRSMASKTSSSSKNSCSTRKGIAPFRSS